MTGNEAGRKLKPASTRRLGVYKKWELLLVLFIPSFLTLWMILLLALPRIFLPDYQDAGPPLGTTHLANYGRLAARFALPPFVVYALWMRQLFLKRERVGEVFWSFLLWVGALLFPLVSVTYEVFNVALDRGAPLIFRAPVAEKYIESTTIGTEFASSATTYVLKLPSWRPDRDWHLVAVEKAEYERVLPAKSEVTLRIRQGRFGQPWLESYRIHSPPAYSRPARTTPQARQARPGTRSTRR